MSEPTLEGRTAVSTGATGGMGRAITTRLAAAGANVVASDLDDGGADELLASCGSAAGSFAIRHRSLDGRRRALPAALPDPGNPGSRGYVGN